MSSAPHDAHGAARSASAAPVHGSARGGVATTQQGLPTCLRCGFAVTLRPWGCKNPCGNCGFVYPLGDCSD